MAKKKKSTTQTAADEGNNGSSVAAPVPANGGLEKNAKAEPKQPPALVICRNKHWRYISSYHGPWLNLPPEVLETLAYSNYYSPLPQPIDPAVFFDLIKIRRLIDDATSLSVRAANGTTAASLTSSLNSNNGYLNSNDAEILGIGGSRGGGAHAKLSRERKFRMREHATSKLSHAYRLDEIAASVATMQSASALEEVAGHVLAREETDLDAQYVHFFHEKIPSRAMAESTNLDVLTDIISQRPTDAATYRTRAVTRIFKDDYHGAARDLTEALAIQRLYHGHRSDQLELILAKDAAKLPQGKLDEKDHPSSMEPQLLFLRANAYLTLACQNIAAALARPREPATEPGEDGLPLPQSPQQKEEARARMEARKLVRTYAKRSLRDYTNFLSHFDYTPGLSAEFTEAFLDKVASMASTDSNGSRSQKLLDIDAHSQNGLSEALVKYERRRNQSSANDFPQIPKPAIHKVSELFNPVPPPGLPQYPAEPSNVSAQKHPIFSLPDFSEAVTYHPLLTDVLHSLLLCHCLVQTSVKEHQRHAHMAARIARVCDGYPIFLAARSPSRADWIEVLRKTKNWIGLEQTWEQLCMPPPDNDRRRRGSALAKTSSGEHRKSSNGIVKKSRDDTNTKDKMERIKQDAIRDALADERVVDEDTFRQSVRAREARAIAEEDESMRKEYHNISPSRTNGTDKLKPVSSETAPQSQAALPQQSKAKQNGTSTTNATGAKSSATNGSSSRRPHDQDSFSIATERAEMIARWILEAPALGSASEDGPKKKRGAKKTPGSRLRKQASNMSAVSNGTTGLENSVGSLDIDL